MPGGRALTPPPHVLLSVVVVTRQAKPGVRGILGDALKVGVSAPPEGGRANAELVKVLARAFGARRADVAIVSGHAAKRKRVLIKGIDEARVRGVTSAVS